MSQPSSAGRILAVDNTPVDIDVLETVLVPNGFELAGVTSGAAAFAAIEANPPDLVLLDVVMPGLDTIEVCRRLRADARTRNLPIVMGYRERRPGARTGARGRWPTCAIRRHQARMGPMAIAQAAASLLGLDFVELQARNFEEVAAAFEKGAAAHADGMVVATDSAFVSGGDVYPATDPVMALPLQYRIPAIYSSGDSFVAAGGLMGFGVDLRDSHASRNIRGQDSARSFAGRFANRAIDGLRSVR